MKRNRTFSIVVGMSLALTSPALPQKAAPPPSQPSSAPKSKVVEPDNPSGADAARDRQLASQVTPLVDAFLNQAGRFTPDGRRLVFLSNRGGVNQVYVSEVAGTAKAPVPLTQTEERVSDAMPAPDGQAVVFRSDLGGGEKWGIFRVGMDGAGLMQLTPSDGLQHDPPIIPRSATQRLFYSARSFAAATSTVYAQSALRAEPPERIYTDQTLGELSCVSADGKWGIFVRIISQSEGQVLAIDMAAKTARQIFPAEGIKSAVSAVACSADATRVFIATDGGGESSLLVAVDRTTGKEVARYRETSPPTAGIEEVSAGGDVIAININAGDHSEHKFLDAATLKLRSVAKMPLGTGWLGNFTADGRRFAAEWSTPNSPTDVYGVDTATGQVTRLFNEKRPALQNLPEVEVRVTQIPSFDGMKIPMNIYLPKDVTKAPRRRPVIFWMHGGPFGNSSVRWKAQFRQLISLGYAVVEPNVRGSTGFGRAFEMADNGPKRLDSVRDLEEAAHWTMKQPWADKDRLVVIGLSYGGYMVLMALTRQPQLWRAGVDVFGIANLRTFITATRGSLRDLFKTEFGELEKDGEFLDSISPIRDADKITAPLFVYAGANDPRVPRSESDQIVAALRARKAKVEYMVAQNEGHSMSRRENQIEFMSRVARFLEIHLK